MKSMLIASQGRVAVGSGKGEPNGFAVNAYLIRWHVAQVLQYSVTALRVRGHQSILETSNRVRFGSGYPALS
jgi:hypothetical protein